MLEMIAIGAFSACCPKPFQPQLLTAHGMELQASGITRLSSSRDREVQSSVCGPGIQFVTPAAVPTR